jgi:hypothetical protein
MNSPHLLVAPNQLTVTYLPFPSLYINLFKNFLKVRKMFFHHQMKKACSDTLEQILAFDKVK